MWRLQGEQRWRRFGSFDLISLGTPGKKMRVCQARIPGKCEKCGAEITPGMAYVDVLGLRGVGVFETHPLCLDCSPLPVEITPVQLTLC